VAIHLHLSKREARLVQPAGSPRRSASRDDKLGSSLAAPPAVLRLPPTGKKQVGCSESREAFGIEVGRNAHAFRYHRRNETEL